VPFGRIAVTAENDISVLDHQFLQNRNYGCPFLGALLQFGHQLLRDPVQRVRQHGVHGNQWTGDRLL